MSSDGSMEDVYYKTLAMYYYYKTLAMYYYYKTSCHVLLL